MKIVKVLKCSFVESKDGQKWETESEFNPFGKVLFSQCSYNYKADPKDQMVLGLYRNNSLRFLVDGKELVILRNEGLVEDLFWRRVHQDGETLYKEFYVVEGFTTANTSCGHYAIPVGSPLEDSIMELFPHQREKITPKTLWESPHGLILCVDKKTYIRANSSDLPFFKGTPKLASYHYDLMDRWDGRFRKKLMDVTDAQINSYVDAVIEKTLTETLGSKLRNICDDDPDSHTLARWRTTYSRRTSGSHWNNYGVEQRTLFDLLFPSTLKEGDTISLNLDAIQKAFVPIYRYRQVEQEFIERFGRNVDHIYRDFLVKFYANLKVLAV